MAIILKPMKVKTLLTRVIHWENNAVQQRRPKLAKSPAERKKEQRARQAAAGDKKLELVLDNQELEMLARNCATRRPGREPYEANEYIALLIRQDDARVRGLFKAISKRKCGKCGDSLPVQDCCFRKEDACWCRLGWHETKLKITP